MHFHRLERFAQDVVAVKNQMLVLLVKRGSECILEGVGRGGNRDL